MLFRSASVSLGAGTTFNAISENGLLQFYSTSDVAVNAYGSNVAVPVREGRKIANEQLTTSASGQIGQRYSLSQTNVLPSSVSVSVYEDGVTPLVWSRVENINVVASGVNAYAVYVNADGSTEEDWWCRWCRGFWRARSSVVINRDAVFFKVVV